MRSRNYPTTLLRRTSRWCKAAFLGAAFAWAGTTGAQVTTNSGSGLAPTYPDLAAAVTALNGAVMSSPVLITVDPASPQVAPAGGYTITQLGASALNTITIQGGGNTVTASAAHTIGSLHDAIFEIIGGDWITIEDFVMTEDNTNNTVVTPVGSNDMTEFGVAIFKTTTTDGAQNCTIQNNTISLNRLYVNSFGVYSNTRHSATVVTTLADATAATGTNENLHIYDNTISNVNMGIIVIGSIASGAQANGIEIGGSAPNGNTITNFGTTTTGLSGYQGVSGTVQGIQCSNTNSFTISHNTITSSVGGTVVGTLNGIQCSASGTATLPGSGTFNRVISNNVFNLQSGVSSAINGILNTYTANLTTNVTIENNDFTAMSHTVAASGAIICIQSSSVAQNTNVNSNTFTNLSCNTTGSFTFISSSFSLPANGTQNINGNSISGTFNKTGAGGTVTLFTNNGSSPVTAVEQANNNNFSNITVTGATTVAGFRQTDGGTPTKTVSNNTFNNWVGGTSQLTGLAVSFSGAATVTGNTVSNFTSAGTIVGMETSSGNQTWTGNTVTGLTSSGASVVTGMLVSGGTTQTLSKNTICNLEANNASGTVNGILASAGTTRNISNNVIGDLRTPNANAANPLNGINITGGTTANVYNNTVLLNGSSVGALFGSSAISASSTPALTLGANIFVNLSTPNGAGNTVAYRRSTATLTSYQTASDRNLFYVAGGSNRLVFFDGTNSDITLLDFQTRLADARDDFSISVAPDFASTTCGTSNFLRINAATPTFIESGAAPIAGITDDIDGDIRNVTTPDIGADEFAGTQPAGCSGTPSAGSATATPTTICNGQSTALNNPTPEVAVGIVYQWYITTTSGSGYTPISGATAAASSSGALTTGTYFILMSTKCTISGDSALTAEVTVTVNPVPVVSASNNGPACVGASVDLDGTTDIAGTFSWTGPLAYANATEDPTIGSLTLANGGTYSFTTTAAGCTSLTATTTVVVNPAPVIASVTATPNPTCFNGSSQLQVNTAAPGAYCPSTHASGSCGFSEGDKILLVTLNGTPALSNPSGCLAAPGYTDFTAVTASGISVGGSPYSLAVSLGGDANQFAAAFIDWNQDGDFADVNEFIGTSANVGANGIATFSVTVPSGAFNGTTRMRVLGGNDSAILSTQSCGASSSSFGETEDYNVVVSGATDAFTYNWAPSTFIAGQETLPNPNATLVTAASTTYTVTVTSGGCPSTGNVTLTTAAPITAATITPDPAAFCTGGSVNLTAVPTDGAGPYTYQWTDPSLALAGTNAIQNVTVSGTWSVEVFDNCGGSTTTSRNVTENALPSVSISPVPANAAICGGVGNVVMTASGAVSYSWSPTSGLAPTSGSPVTSTATSTTTYTVTGTDANGCQGTATQTVSVGPNPVISSVTATPAAICDGANSQLLAVGSVAGYTIGASGTSFIDISGTGVSVVAVGDDTEHNITIPSFTFNGVAYTTARVGNNGLVVFGSTTGDVVFGNATLPSTANTAGNIFLAPWWDDLDIDVLATNSIKTETVGSKFIIQFTNSDHDNLNPPGGTNFVTFQVQLDLTTGVIYFVYSDVSFGSPGIDAGASATVGIQFSGTSALQSSFNTASLSNGQVISFSPNQPTYSWSPATFLDNASIANPLATAVSPLPQTYTVTASSAIGCTATATVTITEDMTDTDGDLIADCDDNCPSLPGQIGDVCDADPGPGFLFGSIDGTCTCIAVPCTENVTVDLRTDANSDEAGWEILLQNSAQVVCKGGYPDTPYANNITNPIVEGCCLPVGCYRLRVLDSAGDGFTSAGFTGGYQLRESGPTGRRIIDNFENFSTGSTSAISNVYENGAFCVPLSNDELIFSSCDKLDWVDYKYLVCHANAAVSAEWVPSGPNNVQDANSGYEFWIFDPNGSYSYRRFHAHNVSDGFSPASATRAARIKINGWYNSPSTPLIPANVMLNVRVRGRVNGVNGAFGPACRMKIDAARAACPLVKLQDDPTNVSDYSCGVTRAVGGPNSGANKLVALPPQFSPAPLAGGTGVRFQFRFRIPAENVCIVRPPQASPTIYLNWTNGPQLLCNKTYEVEVRVSKDLGATWCIDAPSPACDPSPVTTWGKTCNVTTSACFQGPGQSSMTAQGNGALTMYPNPNNGDQLTISLTEVARDVRTMSVDIYDLTGKRITARTIAVQDGFVTTVLDLNGDIANGMYMVNITAGEKTYTERLVIQK